MRVLYGKSTKTAKDVSRTRPTIGLNVARLELGTVKLLIWDLGGQTSLRVIWDKYYPEAHALIYVIDSADNERLRESHQELQTILSHPDLIDAPVLIFANKQDLQNSISGESICKLLSFDLNTLSSRRSIRIQDISALNGHGIDTGIQWLVECAKRSSRATTITQ